MQLSLIEAHNVWRLLVDQLLHRLLLALRVEAPHIVGDQFQLPLFLSLPMLLSLVVWDLSPFFISLLLMLFFSLSLLYPVVQLFCTIAILAWAGSRVSHGVGSWWRFSMIPASAS